MSGVGSEFGVSTFRSGFQPALQGYRDFPPFLLYLITFTGFAITLIAFRDDISF